MLYRRHRVQTTLRVLLIVASSLFLAYLIGWTQLYEAYLIVGLLIVYQIAALIRYEEKAARDLTRFLEAIRFSDLSVGFTSGGRGPLFDRLRDAFTEVAEAFKRVRAEREEQYRYLDHVVQHVGVALLSFRTGGEVEFINAAARRLLGVGRLRKVQDLASFSEPLTRALLGQNSEEKSTGPRGVQNLVRVEKGGRTLQLSVATSHFRLGEEAYVLASIQDIGSELEEKEMEAWQKLTRVLTHEIMNSVAPIASLAATADDLLVNSSEQQDHPAHERIRDVQEAVRIIGRRSEALIHFVDTYRSFTRIPTPSFEMIPAREVLSRVRRLLGSQIEAKAVTCEVRVEPEGLQLTADPELIEQVLINLLLNAIEAVEGQEGAHVLLRARVDESGVAMLQVGDNGPGIPPEVQEHIFVPFFTTKEHGSGIGLSLSRQIMRLHGGTLTVQSEEGRGTTFTLRF